VEKPSFAVRLADLERGPKKITFALSEGWLTQALRDADALPQGPGEATVELMKSGENVIVRGRARVKVTVPCVVTLDPLPFELEPEIYLQLTRDPEPHPPRAKAGAKAEPVEPQKKKKAPGQSGGRSRRHQHEEPELDAEEAAYDTFRGEEIALDDFFREFILLEIPAYPRRSDLPSPEESISSRPLADLEEQAKPLDPRLAPLLGLANRLKGSEK
jgi:uncharacterized metal-binding protein YceD (DUF177 family)